MPRPRRQENASVSEDRNTESAQVRGSNMMVARSKCEVFNPEVCDIEVWHYKFLASIKLNKIRDAETKRLMFVESLDTNVLGTLINLCKPKSLDQYTYEELYILLTKNFKNVKITVAERVHFFSQKQGILSITDFACRLRQIVSDCMFPEDFFQAAMVTAFIMGISDNDIRIQLMQKEYINFNEVVEFAKTLNSIKLVSSPHNADVIHSTILTNVAPCYSCGGKHLRKDCKHRMSVCEVCKRKGHLPVVCRLRKQTVNNPNNSKLNSVDEILSVQPISSNSSQEMVLQVLINGCRVDFQLDTGSKVTVITQDTWRRVRRGELAESTRSFTSYTGHYLRILGEQNVDVSWESIIANLKLFVAAGPKQNILGRDWIKAMGLNKLSIDEICSTTSIHHMTNIDIGLQEVINKFSSVFNSKATCYSKFTASLYLKPNSIPIFKRARPVPLALRDEVKSELDRLVSSGILEEVECSDWAAPCVVVRKPNGKLRICADFSTGLNQALQVQQFPLPTQDEIFSNLSGGQKFSTLDLTDAYLSIPVDEESKKLLVINTIYGLYRYNRLCFGVAPAPAIFQKTMSSVLKGLKGVSFLLDDIIVTGKDDGEHLQRLQVVLQRISDYGFRLNKEKCQFMKDTVNYLGLRISKEGVSTQENKIQAIIDMPRPTDIKKLESFLGMITYYSKFISSFSELCYPLNVLRRKNCKWFWSDKCEDSFQKLKSKLLSAPILSLYDPSLPLVVAADASSTGIGATIFHRYPDGTDRPIAFASKTLTPTEQRYSQIEREGLAIIFAVKKFRIYLWGREFILQTDHKPLLSIFGSKKGVPTTTSCRLQRWSLFLMNFIFTVEYIPTKLFGKVDGLSRLPKGEDKEFDSQDNGFQEVIGLIYGESLSKIPVNCKEIAEDTAKDEVLAEVLKSIGKGWKGNQNPNLEAYHYKRNELTVHEGCILWGIRVVIPPKHRKYILDYLHETHQGIVKMKAVAREHVWWPNIDSDIEQITKMCTLCNTYAPKEPQKMYLNSWPKTKSPWDRIHVDFAGPFLKHYFLLIVDSYSGWLEVFQINNMTTSTTIHQLKLLFCRHGIPRTVVTDNGTPFVSNEFEDFCKSFGVSHVTTPSYHPVSNGQVEKYVHTTKISLKKLCSTDGGKNVEKHLNNFLYRYRVSPHSSTGISPAELFLGRRLRTKLDVLKPNEEQREVRNDMKRVKDFKPQESVFVEETRDGKIWWKSGKITKRLGQNTWLVEVEGRRIKRHADQLRVKKTETNLGGKEENQE